MKEQCFYKKLNKPKFSPPAWLFAPVWILLYFFMLISFVLIFKAPPHPIKGMAYTVFAFQLFLNFSWSPVFFKEKRICDAVFICGVLVFNIAVMILLFYPISHFASLLQIPYLFWTIFATVLNYYICKLN